MEDNAPVGRLLSEELGERLYGALRERIMAARQPKEPETSSTNSETDSNDENTLDDVTAALKERINHLEFLKRVKRGMLLRLEFIREEESRVEEMGDRRFKTQDSGAPPRSSRKRRRPKSRALTARKGARRVGQAIRRRLHSPGHSAGPRLRRRSLPNKGGYALRQKADSSEDQETDNLTEPNFL